MADSVIGALSVKITADADGLKAGVKSAGEALEVGAKKLRSSVNDYGKWAAAGVAAASAVGLAIVKSNLTTIRELKNTAAAADTSVEAFQRGAFAAEQFGISTEKYGDILKDTTERVGDFLTEGAGPMTRFFEQVAPKVGITAEAFRGLSGQDAMGLYVKSLQDANLSQQEMTVFMEDIASDSTRLIPLFKDNAKALRGFSEEAKALGLGLSEIDVEKAEIASEKLAASRASTEALAQAFTVELAPIISEVIDLMVDMANNAGGAGEVIKKSISSASAVVGVFADGLHGIGIIFKGLRVIGLGFVAAVTSAIEGLTHTIATAADGWIMIFNDLFATINDITGSELQPLQQLRDSDFMKGVHDTGEAFRTILTEARSELNDAMLEELPSQAIDTFITETQAKFERLARERVEANKDNEDLNDDVIVTTEGEVIKAETITILEALGLRYQSQEELQLASLEREKEITNADLEAKRINAKQHADEMVRIKQAEEETKREITLSNVQEGFAILIGQSKKAQKAMQGVAIVNAVIKGKEAAVSAWAAGMSTGGPFAPVVAAAYTAASVARTASMISSIKSGGKSQGSSGGGGAVPTGGQSSSGGGQQQQQESSSPRNISINLQGGSFLGVDQVRELIGQINDQVGDGVELNFTGA